MGGRLRFYSPLIVIVSGGLLSIHAAPGEEIKTTECEINNSEPQTLRLVVSVQHKEYSFYMDILCLSVANFAKTIALCSYVYE